MLIYLFNNFKIVPQIFFARSAAKNLIFINIFNKYKRKYGDISSRWYYLRLASLGERSHKYSISALSGISWQAATTRTSEDSSVPDDFTERYLSGASVDTSWTRTVLDSNRREIDLLSLSAYSILPKVKCYGVI